MSIFKLVCLQEKKMMPKSMIFYILLIVIFLTTFGMLRKNSRAHLYLFHEAERKWIQPNRNPMNQDAWSESKCPR